jgi:uncharacterized membrane protein
MTPKPPPRILALDLARTLALLGMAAYHFLYDLQMYGLLPPDYAVSGWLYWHARIVASSFLGLVGISLWLAQGQGLRWPAFWRRWVKVAAAAALVTIGTRIAVPEAWVFFGILHAIALFSLLALPFLRLPWPVTLAAGLAVIWASYALPTEAMNAPLLRFIGLHTQPTWTVDFEPVFPWFAPVLIGLALGRLGTAAGIWPRLARWPAAPGPLARALAWPGRHSLIIYLLHQPILFGLIGLYARYLH